MCQIARCYFQEQYLLIRKSDSARHFATLKVRPESAICKVIVTKMKFRSSFDNTFSDKVHIEGQLLETPFKKEGDRQWIFD
jgi:hypothetical protein